MPGREDVARALAAHLGGLASWGIDVVRGAAAPPSRAIRVPSPPRAPERSAPDAGDAGARMPDLAAAILAPARIAGGSPETIAALAAVAREVAECTACRLCGTRTKTVPGVGDPGAALLFVGEAPGHEEDLRGEPFVGRAGQLLDKIIAALGFRREEVFIANVLKCRPPGNRDPDPDEVAACTPYLERQIAALAPRRIVALGRPAARLLTGLDQPLGRLRGRDHSYRGIPVTVTYHPAYLLRNPAAKADCWQDLQPVVREFGRPPLPR